MEAVERVEAAEFLGVSVSTLDRFASQGRLTRGRARRKTRPVTTFDEGELSRLKAELAESGRAIRQAAPEPVKAQDAVGFRLDPSYVERLKCEGAKRGMSAGEYARRLVVRSLEDDGEERLQGELRALRENLAEMFYLVLVTKLGASEKDASDVVASLTRRP